MNKLLAVLLLALLLAVPISPSSAQSDGEGLYPFTRRNQPIEYGQTVALRVLENGDRLPGHFGWLSWNGRTMPTIWSPR